MSRRNLFVAAATMLVAAPVAARAQQQPASPAASISADSIPAVMLESVIVTARQSTGLGANLMAREQIRYLSRENAHLSRQLRHYDERVAVLVAKVDSVHQVGAALESDIDAMTDATTSTRARRLQLEARLREIEGADAVLARKDRLE